VGFLFSFIGEEKIKAIIDSVFWGFEACKIWERLFKKRV